MKMMKGKNYFSPTRIDLALTYSYLQREIWVT